MFDPVWLPLSLDKAMEDDIALTNSLCHFYPILSHDSAIKIIHGSNGLLMGVPRPKPLLTKQNIKTSLIFTKNTCWWSPRLLGKYSVNWWDKSGTFCVSLCASCDAHNASQDAHWTNRISEQEHDTNILIWWCNKLWIRFIPSVRHWHFLTTGLIEGIQRLTQGQTYILDSCLWTIRWRL